MPRTESAVLGGLPFTSSDFLNFRTHGPRMRIDDLSSPSGRFVARVSASVTTVDRRTGLRVFSPAANTASALVFVVPFGGGQGSAEAHTPAMFVAQRPPPPTRTLQGEDSAVNTAPAASTPSGQGYAEALAAGTIVAHWAPIPTSTLQGEDSEVITGPAASAPSPPGNSAPLSVFPFSGTISTRTRRRTDAAAGTASPAVDYGLRPGGALGPQPGVLSLRRERRDRDHLHPSCWPRLLPPRRSRPYPSRQTSTAPSPWELPFYGFRRQLTHRPLPRLP